MDVYSGDTSQIRNRAMPCSGEPTQEYMNGYKHGQRQHDGHNQNDLDNIRQLKGRVKWLEGALCAVISELKRRDIDHSVITAANAKGKVNIFQFDAYHSAEDSDRLSVELSRFSADEIEVIKTLINQEG